MKRFIGYLKRFLFGIVASVVLYIICAAALSIIPVNSDVKPSDEVTIYLQTNGVHADLVLPVKNGIKDWSNQIRFEHVKGTRKSAEYISFGWGDKKFYMETPTWSDLKISTAFSATFGLGPAAIHTNFYDSMNEDETRKRIQLSAQDYRLLVDYIEGSFDRNADGSFIHIETDANYGDDDAFYEAKGSYSFLKTCNTWVNSGLKSANQKAALWTPSDKGIFYHYD